MKIKHFASLLFACSFQVGYSQIIINEFLGDPANDLPGDANGDGVRNSTTDEFIEFVNTGTVAVDLAGYVITDETQVRHTFPDDGSLVPAGGAIVVFGGETPTGTFGDAIIQVASTGRLTLNNNGDTISLFLSEADILNTPIATYEFGTEVNGNQSLTREPDLTGDFVPHSEATNSNGALFSPGTRIDGTSFGNVLESLTVSLSPDSIIENAGPGAVSVTVSRSGPTTSAVTLTILSNDETEAVVSDATTFEIPAGSASATFTSAIDVIDDPSEDGAQIVTITASAGGLTSGTATLTVNDDGDITSLLLNEIHADPASGAAGDANGDGFTDGGDDEFIELINVSGGSLDLSGWAVYDGVNPNLDFPNHTFPEGTTLAPDCALVLFSGGSVENLSGGAIYRVADGSLSLNNAADRLTIIDENQIVMLEVDYVSSGISDESLNLDPDLTGTAYQAHSGLTGSSGALFSPGFKVDGTDFCPPPGELTITISPDVTSEGGGDLTATISRTGSIGQELEVILSLSDQSEAFLSDDFVLFLGSESSKTVTITPIDDTSGDGDVSVTLKASGELHAQGLATFTVQDNGDLVENLVINEVLYSPGTIDSNGDGLLDTGDDEFIELVNNGEGPLNLAGWTISDGAGVKHTFTSGTTLQPLQGILVFGGGELLEFSDFGTTLVQVASTNTLGLNDGGDTITVRDSSGTVQASLDFTDDPVEAGDSYTRSPDLTGAFTSHSLVGGGFAASPGTQINGGVFGSTVAPYSVEILSCSLVDAGFEIVFTASGASDVYVTTDLVDFALASPAGGIASGTFTDTDPPADKAFYLIQAAGAIAP